ncbi:MAG: DUF975 family protein [Porticoccaceae bacterium]
MWKRKGLKKAARAVLRVNYVRAVVVCAILAVFVGAYGSFVPNSVRDELADNLTAITRVPMSNAEIVNDVVSQFLPQDPLVEITSHVRATNGILAGVVNNATKSGSFVFGILNGINQVVFGGHVMAGIIILVGAALLFLYWMFVGNVLRVGECRFFLENRAYPDTRISRILYLFKIRRVGKTAVIMFFKMLFIVLWSFTIAGGFIKAYSYRLVPYIVAENPDISRKGAFRLSQQMMRGQKWKTFLLDVSFWGWNILSLFTFNILAYLYVNPYKAAVKAEQYIILREKAKEGQLAGAALMNDPYLLGRELPLDAPVQPQEALVTPQTAAQEYPAELFGILEAPGRKWLSADCHRRYSLGNLVLMFFAFCVVGWLWEVFVDLFNTGTFVNRGTLHGPWLPIYGTAGVLVVVLFRRWVDRPILVFFMVMGFCGLLEFGTSWVVELITGRRWWDYSGYFLNIDGRVCLEGLLVFGIAGCLGIYLLGPMLDDVFNKIPKKTRATLCTVLVLVFAVDLGYSAYKPNMATSVSVAAGGTSQPAPAGQAAAGQGPLVHGPARRAD